MYHIQALVCLFGWDS